MRGIGIALASSALLVISPVKAADTPPHLDTSGVNMQPAYPASALKNSERGAAVIGVNVSETGKVNYAYPLKTSGFDDLDAAATMGVLGWRFIPATNNGKAAAGDTAVEIVFQPPDPPNGSAKTSQPLADPPKPAGDFLSRSIQMDAQRGQYHETAYPALCPNGTFKSTIEFQHPLSAPGRVRPPGAWLAVKAGKDDVVMLQLLGRDWTIPALETFSLNRLLGDDTNSASYSYWAGLGRPETLSLSWDSTGLVTGMVGAMEKHEARLKGPPSQFVLGISSGAAKFTATALVCRPGNQT